jgi:hypothetical protein
MSRVKGNLHNRCWSRSGRGALPLPVITFALRGYLFSSLGSDHSDVVGRVLGEPEVIVGAYRYMLRVATSGGDRVLGDCATLPFL